MNPIVVFLHYHGLGHINPCLPLAEILKAENYAVHFAGHEHFEKYVVEQGFPYYKLNSVPFGMGFESWMNTIEKKKHLYLSILSDRISDRLYHMREQSLQRMLDDLQPNVIFIDSAQATDFIALYPAVKGKDIRIGLFHAILPTHVIPGRPPANSFVLPDDRSGVRRALANMRWQKMKKVFRQKAMYLFCDDSYIINRRLKRNKVPQRYRSTVPNLFNFAIHHVHEFFLAPREFDFPDFKVDAFQHYIGFKKSKGQSRFQDDEYDSISKAIVRRKHLEHRKLVYCAFGSTELDQFATVISFLNKLIVVTARLDQLLIISIKLPRDISDKLNTADHVYVFKVVPQQEVLSYSDLFVTHGGLSSIKESIDTGVPMLMYPVHKTYDVVGNSARVVYHGMGLRGDALNDTEKEIEEKVVDLLSSPSYREKLEEMKRKNSVYTETIFLKTFSELSAVD